jgi:hypothetical protein
VESLLAGFSTLGYLQGTPLPSTNRTSHPLSDDVISCCKLTFQVCRSHDDVAGHPCLPSLPSCLIQKQPTSPGSVFLALLVFHTFLYAIMLTLAVSWLTFSSAVLAAAAPSYNARPFVASLDKRQSQNVNSSLQVDLGYGVYQGVANSSTGLNTWKGYAAC